MPGDRTIERGDRFEVYSDPTTTEVVVVEIGQISGYRAAHVAERSVTGEWSSHWLKASYLHDELNLGATGVRDPVDEDYLETVEGRLGADDAGDGPAPPEGVTPAAPAE